MVPRAARAALRRHPVQGEAVRGGRGVQVVEGEGVTREAFYRLIEDLASTRDMLCRPDWDGDEFPFHRDECPAYDGKRCKLCGWRPDVSCIPAVRAAFAMSIRKLEGA